MAASIFIVRSPELRDPEAFAGMRAAISYARGFTEATVERRQISDLRGPELYARLYNRKGWAHIACEVVFDSTPKKAVA